MYYGDPLNDLADSLHSAINVDLSPIEYDETIFDRNEKKRVFTGKKLYRRQRRDEVYVTMFPQTWGSTALGFGGIGGAAMTTAYTVIVTYGPQAAVYFSGRLAYKVDQMNDAFRKDEAKQCMASLREAGKYR